MPPRTGDETTEAARREVAARVRAAMGYAGLKLDDIVRECSLVTAANIRRTVGARRDTPPAELLQIAEACGVPWSWFAEGEWRASDSNGSDELNGYLRFGEGSLDERVLILETYIAVVLRALAALGIDATSLPPLGEHQPPPATSRRASRSR